MEYFAHSPAGEHPGQLYRDHTAHVCTMAGQFAREAEDYAACSGGQLEAVVRRASQYHDLGKLDSENQAFLHRNTSGRGHLPVNHVDAGVAFLNQKQALLSSLSVSAHHRGLPNVHAEALRWPDSFRDADPETRNQTDQHLSAMLELHRQEYTQDDSFSAERYSGDPAVFSRLALSCLADADHTDTAQNAGAPAAGQPPALKPAQRLEALDHYVRELEEENRGKTDPKRQELRSRMYETCRNSKSADGFVSCDSPVGSGKTTAIMAHLLQMAQQKHLRRIFVVLPYTNIITQSVQVYREALVLPGENPQEVVAELHHLADFDTPSLRHLTALWRAPIIVTTAVAFFETLASNRPSALRRLHELPGSAVFLDEAHAALPVRLIPLAWHWMRVLSGEWGCHWLLASGSLVRFWNLPQISEQQEPVSELVDETLRQQLLAYEHRRIQFQWEPRPLSAELLMERVVKAPGPRLVIVNTIQTAAVLAKRLAQKFGSDKAEHLSTALTPEDRAKTIARIHQRLADQTDTDWTLIATSCVEAGVNFSFRTGFREAASLVSLLQTAGRVNRGGVRTDAEVWTFRMQDDPLLTKNPVFHFSSNILWHYFETGIPVTPTLCTEALKKELVFFEQPGQRLCCLEKSLNYPEIARQFRVIESDTVPVIVDPHLAEQFLNGNGDWKQMQSGSVSIRRSRLSDYQVSQLGDNLYLWKLPYNSFLGYMAGVLEKREPPDSSEM